MEAGTAGFNGDDLLEILSKLPLKSVHRFKCVSKEWNALTTTSDFLSRHRVHNRPHLLVLSASSVADRKSARVSLLADEDESRLSSLNIPFLPRDLRWDIRIVGYSNGLVCCHAFVNGEATSTVVWNPLTHKYNFVNGFLDNFFPYSVMGFEFIHENNACKLAAVNVSDRIDSDDPNDSPTLYFSAQVFMQGTSTWRPVESRLDIGSYDVCYSSESVTVNGVLHWLVEHASNGLCVASFSLHDEVFKDTCKSLPEEIRNYDVTRLPLLFSWRKSLAVVGKDLSDNLVFWVEGAADQESDWIEVMRFKWPSLCEGTPLRLLTGVWKDQLVFCNSRYDKDGNFKNGQVNLFLFDPETQKLKKLHSETDASIMYAVSYAKSNAEA